MILNANASRLSRLRRWTEAIVSCNYNLDSSVLSSRSNPFLHQEVTAMSEVSIFRLYLLRAAYLVIG